MKEWTLKILKINDEEFEVAICGLGLMYAPNPVSALKEMYRVLKKEVPVFLQFGEKGIIVAGQTYLRLLTNGFLRKYAQCFSI